MRPRVLNYKNDVNGALDCVVEIKWADIPDHLQNDILAQDSMEKDAESMKKSIEDRLSALFN